MPTNSRGFVNFAKQNIITMSNQKPSIPKGTRDFGPTEMLRRNYIFDVIRKHFRRFGFMPIETPAMENMRTLMGKYGEEGDRLIFKILNSGNFLEGIPAEELQEEKLGPLTFKLCEKALRYDLTVPFARFVVQHRNELSFPFKRYQIQPVWRADRPQKGRYREFYQCDADMIGSNSLLNELELIQLIDEVFAELGIRVILKINNRKVLSGIAEITGEADKLTDITVAIDKLDKIGEEAVIEELRRKSVSEDAIGKLRPLLSLRGSNEEKITLLGEWLSASAEGLKGVEELRFMLDQMRLFSLKSSEIELDLTLARGLNYYTGAIFEVKAAEGNLRSSITGGGRYDDLTGIFGLPDMSGVGISFGADRIYDVMTELELFPAFSDDSTTLLFVNFGEKEAAYCMQLLRQLRAANINAELYPDTVKMARQLKYADDKKIPFVALIGSAELEKGTLLLKNMQKGEQTELTPAELIEKLAAL